jgi:hypothetical protein
MSFGGLPLLAPAAVVCLLVGACGGSGTAIGPPPTTGTAAIHTTGTTAIHTTGTTAIPTAGTAAIPTPLATSDGAHAATASLLEWPEFGLNPQRSNASADATGITTANVARLHRLSVALPGTVDSSPIYLHGASVAGATHDVVVATTTYGKTLAIDANDGRILWTFTPPGYSRWAGTAQITTASPLADPDGLWIYAASPDGQIHKLSLADGREDSAGRWPVSITRDPTHEKIAAALNIEGSDVIAATGGYLGDIPPYQGHAVLIDRSTGQLRAVFNTLCANRRTVILPSSCAASDSAILSRSGPVVEPGGRILIDTGNAPWNGTTDFGDSVLELTFPALRLRQAFTPVNQAELNSSDTDLGSSAPALLGHDRIVLAGKDGIMRVLALSQLDGQAVRAGGSPYRHERLGGEVQRVGLPGGGQLFTAPAVWQQGSRTTMFVAGENGTGAYTLSGGKLHLAWQNNSPGTSPVMAGGLLYVYDPTAGGIDVYTPRSPHAIAHLPGSPGHWNSPIVLDGHVVEPEGNANDHLLSGSLDLFSVASR